MARSGGQRQRDSSESQLRNECAQKLDQAPREEAHAVCERLYDASDADKLTQLGTIYGQHGDVEAAVKPLRRAAELAPHSPQMQYNLALAYYQLNQFEEARTPLSAAVTRWPDIFQIAALYGAVLSKLGEDLPAYQALQHAHQLNAQDAATADFLYFATLAVARKAQSARQYPDALRYFQEAAGVRVNALHGNKSQPQREKALDQFRSGRARVLVATDIAARGLDVTGVSHVINYDLPAEPESYVHRIGRT